MPAGLALPDAVDTPPKHEQETAQKTDEAWAARQKRAEAQEQLAKERERVQSLEAACHLLTEKLAEETSVA